MGANTGQVIFNVAGAILNFYYPGAGIILSYAGQALFPTELPDQAGPRQSDTGVGSTIGAPINLAWGTITVPPNIIYAGELVETANTQEQGGKGGPVQNVTTYTYTRTFALGLCQRLPGRESAIFGVRRILAGSILLYDVTPQSDDEDDEAFEQRLAASEKFAEQLTVYTGTATQLPDPTLEADKGVGNVPAFRNLAYLVIKDFDVTTLGGRPPPFQVEVVTEGTVETKVIEEYRTDYLAPWVSDPPTDPRNCDNDHEYQKHDGSWTTSLATALATWGASDYSFIGWSTSGAHELVQVYGLGSFDLNTRDQARLHFNKVAPGDYVPVVDCSYPADSSQRVWGLYHGITTISAVWTSYCGDEAVDGLIWTPGLTCGTCSTTGGPLSLRHLWYSPDLIIFCRRVPRQPDDPCAPRCEDEFPDLPENPDYCVMETSIVHRGDWELVSGSFKVLQTFQRYGGGEVYDYWPLGPIMEAGSADDTQANWENLYDVGLIAYGDELESGLTYPSGYPANQAYAWKRSRSLSTLAAQTVQLADIVTDICSLCRPLEVMEFDASNLTESVVGYRATSVATARGLLDPLRQYGFFDIIETGGTLRFPLRGSAEVATLGDDDLGAYIPGSDRPPTIASERADPIELARAARVHYLASSFQFQAGQQDAGRVLDQANAVDLNLPIAMSDDKAAQIAEIAAYEPWLSRESGRVMLGPHMLALDPTDPVLLPVNGELVRYRIVSLEIPLPSGPIAGVLARDEAAIYDSDATGKSALLSGDEGLELRGPTQMVIIDGPALDSAADEAGFYAACRGYLPGWRGAAIFVSTDDGANWTQRATTYAAATMGTLVTAPASGPTTIWDRGNQLVVALDSGVLESRTEEAVLNGANAAFIGADGRWELLQFTDAELDTDGNYVISNLLRGRRGTEWAVGSAVDGDAFILVTPALVRVHEEDSAIGQPRQYKAVTLTTLLQAAGAVDFTPTGTALECYSVAQLVATLDDDTLSATWVRRTRISGEWLDNADVPLNEAVESYDYEVTDAAGDIVASGTVSTPTFSATVDLSGQPFTVAVWQSSDTVGRGYPAEVIVP